MKKQKKRKNYTNKEAIIIILFYLISFILIEWLFITLGLETLEHFMRLSVA